MKNFKKLAILLSCISLLICIGFIMQAYAKYTSSISGSSDIQIARWDIVVNTVTVKSESSLTGYITPVFLGNEYIANDVIAPTAEGYFELTLDFSQVDVSFDYSISFAPNVESSVVDLVATKYVINGVEGQFDSEQVIKEHVSYLDDRSVPTKVTIYFIWDDAPGTMMNNAEDTIASFITYPESPTRIPAIFDVTVDFIQTPIEYNVVP